MPRILVNTLILCLILIIVYISIEDIYGFPTSSQAVKQITTQFLSNNHLPPNAPALVVASRSADNVSWLYDGSLSSWNKQIYVVDNAKADLHVTVNKGRESMVYLTYGERPMPS